MEIQRTTPAQSAAGALMAALAKGDKADAVTFQQEFTDSIEATSRRRQPSERRDRPIEADGRRERSKTERTREAKTDDGRTRDTASEAPMDIAPTTDPSPTTDTSTPQAEDASRTSEAVSADPAAEASREDVPAEPVDETQAVTVAASSGASLDQGDRVLLKALESAAALAMSATPGGGEGVEEAAVLQSGQAVAGSSLATETAGASDEGDSALATGTEADAVVEGTQRTGPIVARRGTIQGEVSQTGSASSGVAAGPVTSSQADVGGESAGDPDGGANSSRTATPVQQVGAETVSFSLAAPSARADTAGASQGDEAAVRVLPVSQRTHPVQQVSQTRQTGQPSADQTAQMDRIARVMRASISRGGSRVNLQLEPRDIGQLRVQMNLRGGELVARFETQTDAARQMIEQGIQQLRQGLAAGGIQLVDATVESRESQNQALDDGGQGFAQQGDTGADQDGGRDADTSQGESHSDGQPWAEVATGEESLDVTA